MHSYVLLILVVLWGAEVAIVRRLDSVNANTWESDASLGAVVAVVLGVITIAPPLGAHVILGIILGHAVATGALGWALLSNRMGRRPSSNPSKSREGASSSPV